MIHTIILPKDKFTGLTKPEIRGGISRPPPGADTGGGYRGAIPCQHFVIFAYTFPIKRFSL